MITIGSLIINVGAATWFLCVCRGCDAPFSVSVDPRLIESYRCPCCASRIDGPPLHGRTGMVSADAEKVRLGDGIFVGLPAGLEQYLRG